MPAMPRRRPRLAVVVAPVALLVAVLVGVVAPAVAQSGEQPVQLSAKPLDQPGQFFDLTLEPGQTRELEIELGNAGGSAMTARTYAADVYTIINGGFGAELRQGQAAGATTWLSYPTEVLELLPGRPAVRAFTVSVPARTPAGEYVTSVVLENDAPVEGEGSVALDQVVRQAVAVAVRVPGKLTPDLAIGSASHSVVAERSVVAVEVSNTGTMRVTPAAKLVLRDETGAVLTSAKVAMDSFYADSATKVEVPLESLLRPGRYTVDLALDDEERGAHASAAGLPFVVVAPVVPAVAEESLGRQLVDVLQAGPAGLPAWVVGLGALLLVLVLVGAAWGLKRSWQHAKLSGTAPRRT